MTDDATIHEAPLGGASTLRGALALLAATLLRGVAWRLVQRIVSALGSGRREVRPPRALPARRRPERGARRSSHPSRPERQRSPDKRVRRATLSRSRAQR
jgi:hypothetical protein